MAYLHTTYGKDYKILASRNSVCCRGHKDYLVQDSVSNELIIANCWNPKSKCWAHGTYYGKRPRGALDNTRAYKDFRSKKH